MRSGSCKTDNLTHAKRIMEERLSEGYMVLIKPIVGGYKVTWGATDIAQEVIG